MKLITQDGLLLCQIQANAFQNSIKKMNCSSEVFIRRFLNSQIATELDNECFLDDTKTGNDIFIELEQEYGETNYGKNRFDREMLAWMGYLYRYLCFTYELSSKQAYKLIKPKELRDFYVACNEMNPKEAIETIFQSKNISFQKEDVENRNFEILKNIRLGR